MTVAILGGLGLFLLGMSVMTDGLKAMAGSALRTVLARASATPTRATAWGALMTLVVQSSSATTMTTIGLVSAGLLTFPQALGVIFGANIGTTGTGWLVALLGVKVSLNAAAMPLVFAGSLMRLMGRGRWAGAGGALAGFGLLMVGLTVLQEGMAGLSARINPEDLPAVTGVGGWPAVIGVVKLVLVGLGMTIIMQSSSASIAVTISALHAGAIAPDQAAALVIGQNIGSAVSSGIAAIGANTPARRTAVAHVMFNVLTGAVALSVFAFVAPMIVRGAARFDPPILLAIFHTVYNLTGVAILLPLVGRFARLVERIVPQRGPTLSRHLDQSVLALPAVAIEAARRTVGSALGAIALAAAGSIERAKAGTGTGAVDEALLHEASAAIHESRVFLSSVSEAPQTELDRNRLSNTLHALDHTARLTENTGEPVLTAAARDDAEVLRAAEAVSRALRIAGALASGLADPDQAPDAAESAARQARELGVRSAELAEFRRAHRRATLGAAAAGTVAADDAIARVESARRLDRLVYHAWRASAHLTGIADTPPPAAAQSVADQAPAAGADA